MYFTFFPHQFMLCLCYQRIRGPNDFTILLIMYISYTAQSQLAPDTSGVFIRKYTISRLFCPRSLACKSSLQKIETRMTEIGKNQPFSDKVCSTKFHVHSLITLEPAISQIANWQYNVANRYTSTITTFIIHHGYSL